MRIGLAILLALVLPMAALAQSRMSKEQLIAWATKVGACQDLAVEDVAYVDELSNRVHVTCADATGLVPLAGLAMIGNAGAAAAVLGLGVAVAAGGGGGSTSDTR